MDSLHLDVMCNVHNHHFALCSHDKKQVNPTYPLYGMEGGRVKAHNTKANLGSFMTCA